MALSQCTVCHHDDALAINSELVQQIPQAVIAARYGLSPHAVRRHLRMHLLAEMSEQGLQVISVQDVIDIPMRMRQRGMLIDALIDLALEPLGDRMNSKLGISRWGIDRIQGGLIVKLLRIQQIDEQTVLRVTGALKPGNEDAALDERQFIDMRKAIEGKLVEIANGTGQSATEARLALSELIMPMDEFTRELGIEPLDD